MNKKRKLVTSFSINYYFFHILMMTAGNWLHYICCGILSNIQPAARDIFSLEQFQFYLFCPPILCIQIGFWSANLSIFPKKQTTISKQKMRHIIVKVADARPNEFIPVFSTSIKLIWDKMKVNILNFNYLPSQTFLSNGEWKAEE